MPNSTLPFLLKLILFSVNAFSQQHLEVPKEYIPTYTEEHTIVYHQNYILGYSEKHEQAVYVIYHLTKEELNKNVERSNNFRVDEAIITESSNEDDYYKSGYDRGHLAPAADMSFNYTAMNESFFYSNMSPQVPSFNRGIWKKMEELVRDWAFEKDSVIVVTGPILSDDLEKIGPNEVSVPKWYYKVIVENKEGEYSGIGLLVENRSSNQDVSDYFVTIDSIEKISNINFFAGLDEDSQEVFETKIILSNWTINSSSSLIQRNKKGINKTKQCQKTTKSGSRCKRKVKNDIKYCWQHE